MTPPTEPAARTDPSLQRVEADWRRRLHHARQPKWKWGPFRSTEEKGFTLDDMAEAHRLATVTNRLLFRSLLHCAETHNTVGAEVLLNGLRDDEWSRRTGHKIVPSTPELRAHLERRTPSLAQPRGGRRR